MSKTIRVTSTAYSIRNGELVTIVAGRSLDGERVVRYVKGCEPYFYEREDDVITGKHAESIVRYEYGYESYDGIPLRKVVTETPSDVRSIADERSDTWEADIPFYRRTSIDDGLVGYVNVPSGKLCGVDDISLVDDPDDHISPRLAFIDIEVEPVDGGFEQMVDDAEARVTAVTAFDSYSEEYTLFLLDPDRRADSGAIRDAMRNHWNDERGEVDIKLIRAESEKDLLSSLVVWFKKNRPDIVTGWNYVDFDHKYLLRRMQKVIGHGAIQALSDCGKVDPWRGALERRITGVPAFDLMDALTGAKMSYTEWRSSALDYVAEEILGVGKVESISADSWNTDIDRFAAYNVIDVQLCVELNKERRILEFFLQLAELTSVQVVDTFSEMRLIDGYMMSRGGDDEILPSISDKDIDENAGGMVLEPSTGITPWVGVLDVKSLYPSAIITWNLSPETIHWWDEEEPDEGQPYVNIPWVPDADEVEKLDRGVREDDIQWDVMWADLSKEGIVPRCLKNLFPERERLKRLRDKHEPGTTEFDVYDIQQAAVKVIMNAFYGVTSMDYWRMARYGLGDAITSASRYVLHTGAEVCREANQDIVYGDTDSVLISLADDGDDKSTALNNGKMLEQRINSEVDRAIRNSGLDGEHPLLNGDLHGSANSCLVYEFEKLYRRYIQIGKKKRYAGLIVWDEGKDVEKIDVTGFESRRSSSPEITSEAQPEVLRRILRGDGFDAISDYISGLCDDIEAGRIEPLREIAKPASLGRSLETYGNTQTARACRWSNENLGYDWRVGDDPFLYFISDQPVETESVDVIALEWNEALPDGFDIDSEKHIEKALKSPLEPILNEAGWSWADVRSGTKAGSVMEDDW